MISNNLTIARRNITRHKLYTVINILGLSLGICSCIVIYIITSYERSFDTFHPGKERIYRVMGDVTESTGSTLHFARVPLAVSQTAREGLQGMDLIAGIIPYDIKISVPDGGNPAKQFDSRIAGTHYVTTVIAEPQYFEIFRYEWLAGNARALSAPFTVVLTESRARQYFGAVSPDKMLGKQVVYEDSLKVNVGGIIKDWDMNTDLAFTDFISFPTLQSSFLNNRIRRNAWGQRDMNTWTFAMLSPYATMAQLKAGLATLVKTHAGSEVKLSLWPEPLTDIHFNSDIIENPIRTAHVPSLYALMGIALFILILAVINFINLSTAQSIQRAKEVGVRKILGGSRAGLMLQFLTETFVLSACAVLLAILLVKPVFALFRTFIPAGISFHLLSPSTLLICISAVFITTIFAGFYPARVLSSYKPALNIKGAGWHRGGEKWLLRKGLIVFQFTVSLVFIIGSMVISRQLSYTREKDLGFRSDAIITIDPPRGDSLSKLRVFAQRIKQIRGVDDATQQWLSPMTENARGMKLKYSSADEKDFWVTQVAGDEHFLPLYHIRLLAGRNLLKADSVTELIINESLSRMAGNKYPADALGKVLYWNDRPYPVVGVVADFHTSSLHDPMKPLCIINRPEREGSIAIRLASSGKQGGMINAILSQIEKQWKPLYPSAAFNYRFYDESLALLYEKDRQTARLMNISTVVTIFISCIGLFGLVLFTAEKRAKEISIRKILGAGAAQIALLLSREFVVLVLIAMVAATPVAWYFMNRWLEGFAYRIQIIGWIFIGAGMVAVLTALVTVSFQSIKAAVANPVKNLRTE